MMDRNFFDQGMLSNSSSDKDSDDDLFLQPHYNDFTNAVQSSSNSEDEDNGKHSFDPREFDVATGLVPQNPSAHKLTSLDFLHLMTPGRREAMVKFIQASAAACFDSESCDAIRDNCAERGLRLKLRCGKRSNHKISTLASFLRQTTICTKARTALLQAGVVICRPYKCKVKFTLREYGDGLVSLRAIFVDYFNKARFEPDQIQQWVKMLQNALALLECIADDCINGAVGITNANIVPYLLRLMDPSNQALPNADHQNAAITYMKRNTYQVTFWQRCPADAQLSLVKNVFGKQAWQNFRSVRIPVFNADLAPLEADSQSVCETFFQRGMVWKQIAAKGVNDHNIAGPSEAVTPDTVTIVNVVNPACFWAIPELARAEVLDNLRRMHETDPGGSVSDLRAVSVEKMDLLYPVMVLRENCTGGELPFHRGVIISVRDESVTVLALDHGFEETFSKNSERLKEMPIIYARIVSTVTLCFLKDCLPAVHLACLKHCLATVEHVTRDSSTAVDNAVSEGVVPVALSLVRFTALPEIQLGSINILMQVASLPAHRLTLVHDGVLEELLIMAAEFANKCRVTASLSGLSLVEESLFRHVVKTISNICQNCHDARQVFAIRKGMCLLAFLLQYCDEGEAWKEVNKHLQLSVFGAHFTFAVWDEIDSRWKHAEVAKRTSTFDEIQRRMQARSTEESSREPPLGVKLTLDALQTHSFPKSDDDKEQDSELLLHPGREAYSILSLLAVPPSFSVFYEQGDKFRRRFEQQRNTPHTERRIVIPFSQDLARVNRSLVRRNVAAALNSKRLLVMCFGVDRDFTIRGQILDRSQRDSFRVEVDRILTQDFKPAVDPTLWSIEYVPVRSKPSGIFDNRFVVELSVVHTSCQVYTLVPDQTIFVREAEQTKKKTFAEMREMWARQLTDNVLKHQKTLSDDIELHRRVLAALKQDNDIQAEGC